MTVEAFFSCWLSIYALPNKTKDIIKAGVFPLAVHLARGKKLSPSPIPGVVVRSDGRVCSKHHCLGGRHNVATYVNSAFLHNLPLGKL